MLQEKLWISYLYGQYRQEMPQTYPSTQEKTLRKLDDWRSTLPLELHLAPGPLYQPSRMLVGLHMLANQTEMSITNRIFLDTIRRFDTTTGNPLVLRCIHSAKSNLCLIASILPKADILSFDYLNIHHAFTACVIVYLYSILFPLSQEDQQNVMAAQQFLRVSASNGNSLAEACHQRISELHSITERLACLASPREACPSTDDAGTAWQYQNLDAVDFDQLASFLDPALEGL